MEHVENEKGIIYELKINSDTKTLSEKGKRKKKNIIHEEKNKIFLLQCKTRKIHTIHKASREKHTMRARVIKKKMLADVGQERSPIEV